ncbi:cytochrome c3 family protein [uncultured Piscinibacter sp.]|uniref:cytochrome c3 family protein n=1 Tax=uncultured Piscinibacter sp. TaxID=1131835 RepID=UPI00262DB9CF|nr:cytochrome c3 family protein [uncultured Piscinibacter sp.]
MNTFAWVRRLLALTLLVASTLAMAQGAPASRNFDHIKTGFPLTGQHLYERCESCHVNGIFKGTPRDCASCHTPGTRWSRNNVVKGQNHIPTQLACDSCHNTRTYAGARFNHVGVAPGTCSTCHTGAMASGKPGNHIQTTASCDTCHKTSAWTPASGFDHSGVVPGTCATCHNGSRATGKNATHVPVGATSCDACHRTGGTWKPSSFNHTQVTTPNQCASCHTGSFPPAGGRRANHIPYQSLAGVAIANCDTCHKAGFASWTPARFHASVSVSNQCATCHTGNFPPAAGKPNTPIHSGQTVCENCHKSTASWASARVDHSTFTAATNCASCHNGSTATGKTATHVPVGATNCTRCHSTSTWKPSSFNHSQVTVASQCASCHNGAYPPADGRTATHIPYQSLSGVAITNCDSCHKQGYVAWSGARFHSSVTVTTQCASCHTGSYPPAVGKPNTAIHQGVTVCESCHKSTASWASARVDHSTFTAATNCASCHNGSTATGKTATHVPVGATNCTRCHSTSTWKPSSFNHSQVTVASQCASCHNGAYPPADGRTATHIPYQSLSGVAITNCDSCHKQGYVAWSGARFHGSVTISTQCASCHTGSYPPAVGKPNNTTHASVTGNCESCHKSTASWGTVTFAHTAANAVGTGTCDTCHNGTTAKGKSATHIPVTTGPTKCDSCHRSQTSFATSVTMNHTVVAATSCKTCHNGAYTGEGTVGALAKPINHIPEATQLLNGAAMDCKACHSGTSVWTTVTMNHNGSQGSGAGWCKGCHQSGTAYLGNMERMPLNHRNRTPAPIDCSESSCHRPLGRFGTPYTKWN